MPGALLAGGGPGSQAAAFSQLKKFCSVNLSGEGVRCVVRSEQGPQSAKCRRHPGAPRRTWQRTWRGHRQRALQAPENLEFYSCPAAARAGRASGWRAGRPGRWASLAAWFARTDGCATLRVFGGCMPSRGPAPRFRSFLTPPHDHAAVRLSTGRLRCTRLGSARPVLPRGTPAL